jgi:hypothetical protein
MFAAAQKQLERLKQDPTIQWQRLPEIVSAFLATLQDVLHFGPRLPDQGGPAEIDGFSFVAAEDELEPPHQLQEGGNALFPEGAGGSGTERGRVYVTLNGSTWTEDWVVLDSTAFPTLTSTLDLAYLGQTTDDADDYIATLPTGTAYMRAPMTYVYKTVPSPTSIPTGLTGTTYRVITVKNASSSNPVPYISGRLFRRYLGMQGSSYKYEDHWVLKQNYHMPQNSSPVYHTRIEQVSAGFSDLRAFIAESPLTSGWITSTSPDTSYVPISYLATPGVKA